MGNPTDLKFGLRSLPYMELRLITDNFSKANLLGTGYHWKVYRGIVELGKDCGEPLEVTVKTWDDPVDEDRSYFEDEMKLLTCQSVSCNPIMAKLFGYCCEERILALVYDLASVCTMNDKLCDEKYTWLMRVKGALAIARGLASLHERDPPFILRNLEPGNIMLDKNFNPKLFDIGLGSGGIFGDRTGAYLHVLGSDEFKKFHIGHSGLWSTALDVFDFGIILLALVKKRTVFNDENLHIVHIINSLSAHLRLGGHILLQGKDGTNSSDLCSASDIGLQCVAASPEKRPSLKNVVTYLEGLRVLQKSDWNDRGMQYPSCTYCGVPNFKQPISLSSKDLEAFTNNFSESNFLDQVNARGNRSHGKVYRGIIKQHADCEAEQEVLVKIWDRPTYGFDYFEDEMMFLTFPSMSAHPNLVKLIGYCREDELLGLVYELSSLCTLRNILCDVNFSWAHRIKAALGISHALAFLHGQNPPFIHRNLDPSHIVLDKDYNPRLIECGLGSGGILGDRVTNYSYFYGSIGLSDPAHYGITWNTSCDVHSFGLILLSLISARFINYPKVLNSHITFWASQRKRCDIVNKGFRGTPGYYPNDAFELTEIALRCTTKAAEKRPSMEEVVRALEGLDITRKLGLYGSIANGVSGTCSPSRDWLEEASVTTRKDRRSVSHKISLTNVWKKLQVATRKKLNLNLHTSA